MGHFAFLSNPDFWFGYGLIGILLVGPLFYTIGFHKWIHDLDANEVPPVLVQVLAALFFAAIFPITLLFYTSIGVRDLIEHMSKPKGTVQAETIRCWKCSSKIPLHDAFCPICGTDQNNHPK